ncbi:ATP-binding cassette domain-containing protein [bacterium]|nr:ATP-binding cassette domain-containing protein [bacterium]
MTVERLTKVYRNFDRREGITGALVDLFARRYREIRAVDDANFTINSGEIVGYIGANGAGKSTTIKMLTGILMPTSGRISVRGLDPMKDHYAHARQIGVVFGQRTQLWWDLAVIEAFHLLQKIYRIPPADYRRRLDAFVAVLGIGGQLHQPVRKLSLGERMKCDLCASLLHNPPLLFLDEPTIGLDVAVKERVRGLIRQINREQGCTIILTTHDLTDIEELCPRIIIIDDGKIIYDGKLAQIKRRFGQTRRVVLEFNKDYLPGYAAKPLPDAEVPIRFAGYEPSGSEDAAAAESDANSANALDEPGARQFMAQLAELMPDGGYLPVRRLNVRQYQLDFDRRRYKASEVIGMLLEKYDVDDLELHEPELSDIVRGIYEGKYQV